MKALTDNDGAAWKKIFYVGLIIFWLKFETASPIAELNHQLSPKGRSREYFLEGRKIANFNGEQRFSSLRGFIGSNGQGVLKIELRRGLRKRKIYGERISKRHLIFKYNF